MKALTSIYDIEIADCFSDANFQIVKGESNQPKDWNQVVLESDPEFIEENQTTQDRYQDIPEQDEYTADTFDSYLKMELSLSQGPDDEEIFGKLTKRINDKDSRPIGIAHRNSLLDTRQYEVDFTDVHTEMFSANVIAKNMFAQVYYEEYCQVMIK